MKRLKKKRAKRKLIEAEDDEFDLLNKELLEWSRSDSPVRMH